MSISVESRTQHFLDLAKVASPGDFAPKRELLYSFLARLGELTAEERIPPVVVAYACGLSIIDEVPFAIINHGPSFSVKDKTTILLQQEDNILEQLRARELSVLPLKTLTLRVKHKGIPRYFLVSGVGDFKIGGQVEQSLAPKLGELLSTEINVLNRGLTINPTEFDPIKCLMVKAGIVSPFARLFIRQDQPTLSGVLHLRGLNPKSFVALAVTQEDTLIVERSIFHLTLNWWQESHLCVSFRWVQGVTEDTRAPLTDTPELQG